MVDGLMSSEGEVLPSQESSSVVVGGFLLGVADHLSCLYYMPVDIHVHIIII